MFLSVLNAQNPVLRVGLNIMIPVRSGITVGYSFSDYIAEEIRDRTTRGSKEKNLIVLGDFNIDERGENPLFKAFAATGLVVPENLLNLKTTYGTDPKFYDQIAWFKENGDIPALSIRYRSGGGFEFTKSLYKNSGLSDTHISWKISDHYPLWVEFATN